MSPLDALDDPHAELVRRVRSEAGVVVAGCLSGTSADGIDVVLARARDRAPLELLDFRTHAFTEELAPRVADAIAGVALVPADLARLDLALGHAFADAVEASALASGSAPEFVASHGQTVAHHDGCDEAPWTLQLGSGAILAERLGVAVAYDFRAADVAAGGEGAPLVPLVDGELFERVPRPAAILNLGGIANLTLLGEAGATGFDVGPAGALLDGFARRFLGRPFDEGGRVARSGRADETLVRSWLAHPFFAQEPPKSTGRDTFGEPWLNERAGEVAGLPVADRLATAAALVAQGVADALARHGSNPVQRLVVAGGGWHHERLIDELKARVKLPLDPSDRFGVPVDAREALAFALLGLRRLLGRPSATPPVTGARGPRVLGQLIPAVGRLDRGNFLAGQR